MGFWKLPDSLITEEAAPIKHAWAVAINGPQESFSIGGGVLIEHPLAMKLSPPPPLTFHDVDRAIEFAQEREIDLDAQVMKVNRQDWDALVGEAVLIGLLDYGSGEASLMTNQEGMEWLTYKGLRIEPHKDPTIKQPSPSRFLG